MKKNVCIDCKSESQNHGVVAEWEKMDLEKAYQVLAKLLSEDQDYEVKFILTRKDDENGVPVH